jgi:hypothetical protein
VDYGSCRVSECLAKIFVNTNWLMLQDCKSQNNDLLINFMPNLNFLLLHFQNLLLCLVQTALVLASLSKVLLLNLTLSINLHLQMIAPYFEKKSGSFCEVLEFQQMHLKCSRFVISMQAECAVTTDVNFRAELKNVIGDFVPLQLQAHN